ncbi:MAG: ParB/RepB/Spo0J family partition protein, partial [Acetobacteraceae bacterium]|nr:ParB/RepB/Spo0J family partition protein [Acetobacteraceae bacterium]
MNAIAPAPAAVPLGKLDASPLNARRTRREAGIGELAASIAAHGLLQSLVVRPRKGGRFEVVAGGRRHAALLLLASRKELPRNAAIPCRVLHGEDGAAAEASLAENAVRLDMHPADQFDAFAALHRGGEGLGAEEIAARFGVTPAVVRQRLRLAAAAPAILAAYRGGELTLDEVTAFAATEDRDVQERVLRDLLPWQRTPAAIRRLVTEALVPLSDRRVLLVGVDAYERAGGLVHRDLFGAEGEGWIADPALLERLAGERMEEEAARLRAEGWRWVALGDAAGAEAWRCRRVWPVRRPLTGEEEERRAALAERQDALWAEHGDDELPDAAADELAHIEAELDALDGREEAWRAEDVAVAGCALALGSDGVPRATRGLVRPEDEPACPAAEGR